MNSNKFIRLMAYIALVMSAVFAVLQIISSWVTIQGPVVDILKNVRDLALLLAVAFAAWAFAEHNKKWIRILFWVSVVVFAVGIVMGTLNIFGIIGG